MGYRGKTSPIRSLFAAALLGLAALWLASLPSPLFNSPVSSILLSDGGELLGAKVALDEQWRFPPLEKLPEKFKTSLILFEDKRFLSHPGVDPAAMARAIRLNLKEGRVVSGGSTISMQVIRLSRGNPARNYFEKFIEVLLALRLELTNSKDEILNLYASHAPFGGNVVGLEAASWRYFGRSPEQLSWAESAMLAVLPNNPSLIHLGKNRKQLLAKRNKLLFRLKEAGRMDPLQYQLALIEPLPQQPHALPRWAPHLLETLVFKNNISRQGRRIHSTLDGPLQKDLTAILARHSATLNQMGIGNAAILVIDNKNFTVKAYLGNSGLSMEHDSGEAIDIIRRPRSTGSILKPLLFAAMLQSGEIMPSTLIPDIPTQYGNYRPKNYDDNFRGAVPAWRALARSLNVPAVRMLDQYGVHRFYDFLKNIGITTLHRPPEDYGLTLILGGAEATLWELTSVYSNLAHVADGNGNGGWSTFYYPVIQKEEEPQKSAAVDLGPGAAFLTMKALVDVTRPGVDGFWKNFSSSEKISWKTGTSYGHRDAWAIGSNKHYTVGVWAGNANGEGQPDLVGTTAAAPILFSVFDRLHDDAWFDEPHKFLKDVQVCKNDGYLPFGNCETEFQKAPAESHFDKLSPHNFIVHLDKNQRWRVHSQCENVSTMVHRNWFALPPSQQFFYRKSHAHYRPIPKYRDDCEALFAGNQQKNPIEFLYPNNNAQIYIPVDLAQQKGRTVFEAAHRSHDAILFWHLDGTYLGQTKTFHQQALDIQPGRHEITVMDQDGNFETRIFNILGKNN